MTETTLLPADYELLGLLRQAQDLLSMVTAAEADSHEDPDEDQPWQLPDPLAGGQAADVLARLAADAHAELGPEADLSSSDARLYAPDGRYEHLPLRVVALDPSDRTILATTVQICRQALEPHEDVEATRRQTLDDLRDLLGDVDLDSGPWPDGAPIRASDKLVPLVRLVELVTQPPDEDAQVLTEVLAQADGQDVVLTAEQEAIYQRVATRLNTALAGGNPLDRWSW